MPATAGVGVIINELLSCAFNSSMSYVSENEVTVILYVRDFLVNSRKGLQVVRQ